MKKLFILIIAGAAAVASCTKEDAPGVSPNVKTNEVTIGATAGQIAGEDGTRAGYHHGVGMQWHAGDKIGLFTLTDALGRVPGANMNVEFTIDADGTYPSASANFTGELADEAIDPTYYICSYPYHPSANSLTSSANQLKVYFPETQYLVNEGGVMSINNLPMIARDTLDDDLLTFHPMIALFRLHVKLSDVAAEPITVKKLVVTSLPGTLTYNLSGFANVTGIQRVAPDNMAYGSTYISSWNSDSTNPVPNSSSVTVDCGDGIVVNGTDETIFYVGIAQSSSSGNKSGGFRFRFETDNGTSTRAYTKTTQMSIMAGNLYNLPLLEIDAPPVLPTVIMPDANLRKYLVANDYIEDTNDGNGTVRVVTPDLATLNLNSLPANAKVSSIVGLSDAFPNLTTLTLTGNNVVDLDLTGFTKLKTITYSGVYSGGVYQSPPLKTLDAHGLTELTTITALYSANLESLDISGCTALTRVTVYNGSTYHLMDRASNTTSIRFNNGISTPTYYPALKTLKAENLPQLSVVNDAASTTAVRNITIENISFKNCANLSSMTLGGYYQTTPNVTIKIFGTPLVAGFPGSITDYDPRYNVILTDI